MLEKFINGFKFFFLKSRISSSLNSYAKARVMWFANVSSFRLYFSIIRSNSFFTFDELIGKKLSICPWKTRLFAVYGNVNLALPEIPESLRSQERVFLRFFLLEGSGVYGAFSEIESDIDSHVEAFYWTQTEKCIVCTSDHRLMLVDTNNGKIQDPNIFDLQTLSEDPREIVSMQCTSQYLILAGISGKLYWINYGQNKAAELTTTFQLEFSLQFLSFFPQSDKFLVGSTNNVLRSVELDLKTHQVSSSVDPVVTLRDVHFGPITCACHLQNYLITGGQDGTIRFWDCDSFLSLRKKKEFQNEEFTFMAASKEETFFAVGSKSEDSEDELFLLFRERLHMDSVSRVCMTDGFIFSSSISGSLVILKNDTNFCYPLIGLFQLLIATSHKEVFRIDVTSEAAENFSITHEKLNRSMVKVSHRMLYIISEPELRNEQQCFYAACEDKIIRYYSMRIANGNFDLIGGDDQEITSPDATITGHSKAVTAISLSRNQRFLATGCADSTIIVRELDVETG
jgi:WD40 repeat protein